ncbi:MAG: hypothetical protein NTU41_13195 [Chloroflexi bacterium]|nr:hypothetical protein [Chloroflexota bacterium]
MLVHAFSREDGPKRLSEWRSFVGLFSVKADADSVMLAEKAGSVNLHFARVNGDKKWLEVWTWLQLTNPRSSYHFLSHSPCCCDLTPENWSR